MYLWLLVGIGGFIGAILRYALSGWIQGSFLTFPVGTMVVNTTGTFILSFVMFTTEYFGVFTPETRLLITTGIIGAYTTMSTFSYESFRLLESNELWLFALNVAGTIVLCLLAAYAGKLAALQIGRIL